MKQNKQILILYDHYPKLISACYYIVAIIIQEMFQNRL